MLTDTKVLALAVVVVEAMACNKTATDEADMLPVEIFINLFI